MSESTISEPPTLEKEAATVEQPVYTWERLEKQNNYSPEAIKELLPDLLGVGSINKTIDWAIDTYNDHKSVVETVKWKCLSVEKHYFDQAKALKDDPDKQPEFQALWLKADKLHHDAMRCNEMINRMKRLPNYKWLERMGEHDFYEAVSVEVPVYTWEELEEESNRTLESEKKLPVVKGSIKESIGWALDDFVSYQRSIGTVMSQCYNVEQHYFEQAKALKDDPDKQPEFQALWLKVNKLHQVAQRCERMCNQISFNYSHAEMLKEMMKDDFYEPPQQPPSYVKKIEETLSDPRVDPILVQKIREDVKASPEKASSIWRKGIRRRASLEWLGKNLKITYSPSDPEESEEPFTPPQDVLQSTEIYMEISRHISELRYLTRYMEYHIGNHTRTLTEQAKALKDDPDKQSEFQALWSLADKYQCKYEMCSKLVYEILNPKLRFHKLVKTYANILEHEFEVPPPFPRMKKRSRLVPPPFDETPSSKKKENDFDVYCAGKIANKLPGDSDT